MGRIIIRDSDSVEPTIFKDRESKRVISPERDNSTRISLHKILRYPRGKSYEVKYPENDEILYILDGEGYIYDGEGEHLVKEGYCVFIPANTSYQIDNSKELIMLAILSPPRYRDEWTKRKDLVRIEPLF
jgi:mannose-6-phosphate isomerase-like protein (cupin superfamily)